ncbi:metallophosphoesterase [Paenibacillus koleovorans]|uniref:metallophosphoesterase n=1 Tax=Paenibacillus koleovorans TaxID=121608 RepID=UPI000FDB09E7|nr:metallophosphoesterase [Paenibacillus koleovorans]
MYTTRKSPSKLVSALLVVLLAISALATPMTALAAAPAAIPTQVAISIAGGAQVGKSAMSVNWVTDPSVNLSEIIYGTSPNLVGGVSKSAAMAAPVATDIFPENNRTDFKAIHAFNVVLQDLTPETKYYYKVGNASNGYSAIASFIAPADPAAKKPFSFVVTPDTQGYSVSTFDNTAKLFDYIKTNESDAAFLLHMGDVVEDGHKSDEWQYFFDAAQNLLNTLPIMATPGNHDGASYDRDFVQYKSRFNYKSLRKPSGLSSVTEGTVYSFEYGDALFVSLNSFASSADNAIQWDFLANETATTSKQWKIVYFHVAPYDPGASHYSIDNVTGKKLTDAGVDLVLSGHEHAYARSTLKTTSSAAGTGSIQKAKFGEAPTYVIGGSVYNYAYSLDTRDTSWNDYFYDLRIDKTSTGGGAIYSPGVYSKVEVTSNAIIYKTYYKATGSENPFRVIDEFTVTKSGNSITQPTGGGQEPTSVTFLFDSFKQEAGKYIARFNWTTPVTTKITQLYYAKKADFESNGGKFTNVIVGTNKSVDLSSAIANANYNSAGTAYSIAPIQSHKAETAVLEPGTEYVYSVGDGATNVTSVVTPASFTTPASNLDTFNFVWVTDVHAASNNRDGHNDKALTQAFTDFPDASFIVSSGDQVTYGFDTSEWDGFFESNADTFARVPLYMGTGNHEYDGAGNNWAPNSSWDPVDPTLQNLLGRYNPPKNGASFYGGGDGTQRMVAGMDKMQFESSNYYYVYGDTLFLMMDYQDQNNAAQIKAQQDWMKSVVKQNPTKWRVAILHKSLFGYRMADPVASWTNAFDEAGVDVVLMGHDHLYVRSQLYANGANIAPQTYGNGTTYLTNYSGNNDRRGPYFVSNNRDAAKMAYVDVRAVGPGFSNISISPTEIRVTSKGFDSNGTLVTGDSHALVTNTPRTPNLSTWSFPAVPQDVNELTITNVAVTGIAKEGQTLHASVTPSSATATFRWERSTDGTAWTAIAGDASSNYTIKTADVGLYLRSVATGTGFYNGVATSSATAKVTPLAGTGSSAVKIGTASELVAFSEGFGTTAYPIDGKYELSADIDMDGVPFSAIGGGATITPFIGTFNGKGYTIRNLKISSSSSNTGLFAYIGAGGRVANAKLANVDITGGNLTGSIAGTSIGTIENSYVDGKVTGASNTGGIVGLLHAGTVKNTSVTAEVYGNPVGGLVGGTNWNSSGSPLTKRDTTTGKVILNNYVKGTVSGPDGAAYLGAFVGDMGGSSGSLLQTLNGNTVTNAVYNVASGKIGGYWSGSRPIIDSNQVNYYDSANLGTDGLPTGVAATFAGKTVSDWAQKTTFEALGWDFASVWDWDATNNVPVPRTIDLGGDEDNFVTVIANSGSGGTISPDGYVLVERGQDQKFTFTPNQYFEIDTVKVDGVANPEAVTAGEYTFNNVTAVHTLEVTFKISDATSGAAPGLVSTSAYYNRGEDAHIWVTVDFGHGALGIQPENWRRAVTSVKIMKDNALVLDAAGCYWFPSTGYGAPPERLEIAYDDINKLPEYGNLVPGTYDLVITFADLNSSVYTIPLTVEDRKVSTLTVEGGTITVDGAAVDSPAQVKADSQVTVRAVAPNGQRFVKWTATGLANESYPANPFTLAMPASQVALKAEYETMPSTDDGSSDGGDGGNNSGGGNGNNNGTPPTPEPSITEENRVTVTPEVKGNTASATVTAKAVEDAIAFAEAASGTAAVEIKVAAPADAKIIELTIPRTSIGAVAGGKTEALTISTPVASITFDDKALQTIAGAAKADVTVTASVVDSSTLSVPAAIINKVADRPVYEFTVTSGNDQLSHFEGGFASIAVPYTLKAGENANAIVVYYLDNKGNLKNVMGKFDAATGTVKMKLNHFSTYVIGFNRVKFADVENTQWYAEAVDFVAARQLFNGVSDGKFAPTITMTRAMFAMVIANMEGADLSSYKTSEFRDVDIHAWYGQAIAWAAANKIVSGVGDAKFEPDAPITREQMAVMLHNYIKIKEIKLTTTSQPAFADASTVSDWAKEAVTQIQSHGIISGVGENTFAPKANADRASVATIFTNFIQASIQ